MEYPTLNTVSASREMLSTFAGYNHNLRAKDNEFYEMQNMTSSYYPVLSPRNKRAYGQKIVNFQGMIAKDALAWIDGEELYYNGNKIDEIVLSTAEDMCPKTMLSMGAYILIFPDKVYFNTQDFRDKGYLEVKNEVNGNVYISICSASGDSFKEMITSGTPPTEPKNGDYWLDTSGEKSILKQYSVSAAMWTQVPTTFIKVSAVGIGKDIKKFDGIKISGLTGAAEQFNGVQLVYGGDDDNVVIAGIIDNPIEITTQEGKPLKVERSVPDCDFYIESENRIWGCKYGMVDGKAVNEIYASALGDAKNWSQFRGIASDSYAVSLGTDGVFTGAITHSGYPLFFKENCIHKIYGNLPSNYQVITINCRGVQKGSHNSLVVVNERLYYKSPTDVCVYDGSLPISISNAFGNETYSEAVAGAFEGKYYISFKDSNGKWHLFVYDTYKSLWHREDNTQVLAFGRVRNKFFYIDAKDNRIVSPTGEEGFVPEGAVEWFVETGVMGYDLPDNKYNSRFNIRMMLDQGSEADIHLQYDSNGIWEHKGHLSGTRLRSFTLPIIPRRCDHMRIKISGKGGCKIFSITKIIEQGSDCV